MSARIGGSVPPLFLLALRMVAVAGGQNAAAMSDKPVFWDPFQGEQWGCGRRVPGRFRGSSSALGEPGPERVTNLCHARPRPARRWLGRASMVDRWRRSSRSKSPSTAQNLSASLVSGARCLGCVVPPPPEGFATWDDFDRALPPEDQGSAFACVDPSGAGPRLFFQRVPEGKVVKNRLHLDVRVGTGLAGEKRLAALEAECARLVALGAVRVRLLPADGDNESCLVMQDIEGNEFDLD
jgi:Glyoxalase-like domain